MEKMNDGDCWTEDELIAAEALLDLNSEVYSFVELLADSSWKRKRRRSCLDDALPIQMPPLNQIKPTKDGGSPTSPDSPFVFPADHKNTSTSRKRSKKNNYLDVDVIEELTRENGLLRGEIGNVKKHYSKLKAYNSQLQTIKLKVGGLKKNVGPVDRVGPLGFDLNLPAEEVTIADQRARYAEARKMRRLIINTKSITRNPITRNRRL